LLVYAIDSSESFKAVLPLHESILRAKDVEHFPMVLVVRFFYNRVALLLGTSRVKCFRSKRNPSKLGVDSDFYINFDTSGHKSIEKITFRCLISALKSKSILLSKKPIFARSNGTL
jgi:hypothetical protein